MKTTIKQLAQILAEEFKNKKFAPCTRRNGKPAPGWTTTGSGAMTQAVKLAGLPYNQFWSGSNPTPSTQVPIEIFNFASKYFN